MQKNVAFYISSHGYGHAVRSAELLSKLVKIKPDWRYFIITAAPEFLFRRLLKKPNIVLRKEWLDFGLIQKEPRSFCLDETATKLEILLGEFGRMVEKEITFLEREYINAVYCDLPFIPFEAASRKSIPCVGLGNFSWDWIYYYYGEVDPVFKRAAQLAYNCYHKCNLYLELPASPPPKAFSNIKKIPLICRHSSLTKNQARKQIKIPEDKKAYLVGFNELSLPVKAKQKLEEIEDVIFLTASPLNIGISNELHIDVSQTAFPDIVRACEGIITKPGYGIVTDAISADIPILYTERGDFPEVPYLEKLIHETVGGIFIEENDFEDGNWNKKLKKLKKSKFSIDTNGADIAADIISGFIK